MKTKKMIFRRIKEYFFPSANDSRAEMVSLIKLVKIKITDDSDMVWTSYESAAELRTELEKYIEQLEANNTTCLKDLYILFLPTASLQEHSLSNGWGKEYLKLSTRFDKLYLQITGKNSIS